MVVDPRPGQAAQDVDRALTLLGASSSAASITAACGTGWAAAAIAPPGNPAGGGAGLSTRGGSALIWTGDMILPAEWSFDPTGLCPPDPGEILLARLMKGGVEVLAQVDGPFCGAWYDAPAARWVVFNDRFGLLPVFYAVRDERLAVATTAALAWQLSGLELTFDEHGIVDVLRAMNVTQDRTLIRGVHWLVGGHTLVRERLTGERSRCLVSRYWEFRQQAEMFATPAQAADAYLDAFQRTVAEQADAAGHVNPGFIKSERFFLVSYSHTPLVWEPGANARNALGIYLLDIFGNRELIYRDPDIGSTNPCPLQPRPTPPVISSSLVDDTAEMGEMILTDIYQGLGDVPRGTIKQLRIIQILPKTTHVANAPPIGLALEENARAILGTVPVEPDGSARFMVPALKPVLFQALDEDGFAYQTMRTITYVQPGERVSCIGCHESRLTTPPNYAATALHRPAATIDPGTLGGRPFSYMEVVQPILNEHCVRCHGPTQQDGGVDLSDTPRDGFVQSYLALCRDRDFWGSGTNPTNAAEAWVPRFGGRNQIQVTPPGGLYGARGSRLIKLLRAGHHDVQLQAEELHRIATWIDLNAVFYGVYGADDQARQMRGEIVAMPEIQ